MKQRITFIIVLLFAVITATYSQSLRIVTGVSKRVSQTPIIDAINNVEKSITEKYYSNLKDYNDFITSCVRNLDNNTESLNYKSQVYALQNFKKNMNYYAQNDLWSDAYSALTNAKRKYYEDLNEYRNTINLNNKDKLEKGDLAFNNNNYDVAVSNYTDLLNTSSDYSYLNLKLGIIFLRNYEYQRSFRHIDKFCKDFPNEALGYYYRSTIHELIKNKKEALNDINKALELDPVNYQYHHKRGWLYSENESYHEAMKDFNFCVNLKPDDPDGYFGRSYVKSKLNDVAGELIDLKKVIEINPKHSMANNNIGWHYFLNGNIKLALVHLDLAILCDSSNHVAFESRGEVKFSQGDFSGSILDMTTAIELDPESSNSYFIRGRSKYKMGDKNGACFDFSKSGELGNQKAYNFIKQYCK